MRMWGSEHIHVLMLFEASGVYYLLWGVLCWLLWWRLGPYIQRAGPWSIFTRLVPLSLAVSVVQLMIWLACFPNLPMSRLPIGYWHRLGLELSEELGDNLVIFWCAFGLFRGIGYYQRYREKEDAAEKLEAQLANSQLSALRMQLNPHFLFNTMNGISSLMRSDIGAADTMLEQLASLLRITLQRGDAQFIPLRDELEFIELYLAMQDRRFGNRVRQSVQVDAELHDALVPAMILQPIVENAYAHGLSKLDSGGILRIEARRERNRVRIAVMNSGVGLRPNVNNGYEGSGVGLSNVKARLRLHYGVDYIFLIREAERKQVQVTIDIPLQLAEVHLEETASFGA